MKLPTEDELRDIWLKKYHDTTSQEIVKKYPRELTSSAKWFDLFPCTQEQNDEWTKECKELLRTKYKIPKRMLEVNWPYIYLNCCPNIKDAK